MLDIWITIHCITCEYLLFSLEDGLASVMEIKMFKHAPLNIYVVLLKVFFVLMISMKKNYVLHFDTYICNLDNYKIWKTSIQI